MLVDWQSETLLVLRVQGASHVLMTVLCAGVSKTQHNWVELAEWAADIRSRQTPDSKAGTEAPLLQRAPPGQTAPGHALLPLSS
jgi:hypothetical protein